MTLKDIGVYKNRLLSIITESEDICETILGEEYDKETSDDDLLYKHIFPYLYIDETQTKQESYICVEVDVPRTMDFTYKDMRIIVWCYCHKGTMKYSHEGYMGTRADILSDMADRLLNSSNDFGLGRLKLQSCTYFSPSKDYYGRQLIYSCPEFNIDTKLDKVIT